MERQPTIDSKRAASERKQIIEPAQFMHLVYLLRQTDRLSRAFPVVSELKRSSSG